MPGDDVACAGWGTASKVTSTMAETTPANPLRMSACSHNLGDARGSAQTSEQRMVLGHDLDHPRLQSPRDQDWQGEGGCHLRREASLGMLLDGPAASLEEIDPDTLAVETEHVTSPDHPLPLIGEGASKLPGQRGESPWKAAFWRVRPQRPRKFAGCDRAIWAQRHREEGLDSVAGREMEGTAIEQHLGCSETAELEALALGLVTLPFIHVVHR